MLKAARGYILGLKPALTAAQKGYNDQLSTPVPPAQPFSKGEFSTESARPDPWMSSDDNATVEERSCGGVQDGVTVDERSHVGIDNPRDRYDATDSCPCFPEHEESINCPDGSVGVEDESTSKHKYHTVRDEIEELTESEIDEINLWMAKYMEGAFVERVKGKVEEIK